MKLLRILVIYWFANAPCEAFAVTKSVGDAGASGSAALASASSFGGASSGSLALPEKDLYPRLSTPRADWTESPQGVDGRVIDVRDPVGAGFVLDATERAWLARLPVLRIGIDPTAAPLTLIGRDGKATGLAMDYLEDALALLGVRSDSVRTLDWPETVKRAVAGDIDLLAAASPRNDALGKRFGFTRPYVEFPVMIVTREDTATIADPADLAGRRVAANMSQGAIANAVHRLPGVEVLDVRTATEGMDAVAAGDADAYVGDIATAEYVIRRDYPAKLKLAAATEERAELSIAVDRRYEALLPLLERALASVSERRAQAIRNTWLRSEYTWGGSWRHIARKAGPAGVAVLVLLLAVTHAYLRLRREIRRRREQADQLAEAKRMAEAATAAKSQFLATMSHEIRTPMHGVIGMLEMLHGTSLDPAQRRLLDTAETSAEALLQILDDILDFSRIEAGRVDIEHVPFDLRRTIEGILDLFARQTQQKGLSAKVRIDPCLAPRIVSDAGRVRQVLLNLVSNAIKFTVEGGIEVGVDVLGDYPGRQRVRILIADTGIGVARADIDRLFAPFSQAEASTTRRFGGSGLGLAICRRLVDLLGGDIAMASDAGVGTRVAIELDVETRSVDDIVDARAPAPDSHLADRTLSVLVAEDNAINRELVAAQLDRLGHRHYVAVDGAEALAIAETHPVDVLLTDLHMPVMDGYALTGALRARGMRLRIVAMTANAMPGERERCLALGMDGFVTKPLRLAELGALLAHAPAETAAILPWDVNAWRDSFGDLTLLPVMVERFETALRDDLALVETLNGPREAADWVHRVLGGMRIFGPSAEAVLAEELELALRGDEGAAAMGRLPELIRAVGPYQERLRAGLADLRDA